jgi:integrase
MPKTKTSGDPTRRQKTRHRGISFRQRRDNTRTYSVYWKGGYVTAGATEQEAIGKQAELRGKAARGERVAITRATFGEVAELWFESKRHLRGWTRKSYRDALDRILVPRFGSMPIGSITADHIASLIRELERKGLSASTISNYLKPLAGSMAFAMRRGMISANPFTLLTRDDRPRQGDRPAEHVWTDEEIARLIEAAVQLASEKESRYDYSPLLRTAVYTGLRLGELLGLKWKDVDQHADVVHVRRQWTRLGEYTPPKTKKAERDVPLPHDVRQLLVQLRLSSRFSGDEDPVFASRNGRPLGHRNVTRRGFEAATERAGIDGVTFHDLRHAYVSMLANRRVPSSVIAELVGHETSAITERIYMRLHDRPQTFEQVRQALTR